jgi:outer membrane protein assembly factor BamB
VTTHSVKVVAAGLAFAAVLLVPGIGRTQFETRPELSPEVRVEEIDQATYSQLERAEKFFAEKQPADALDTLRRLEEAADERLTPVVSPASPKGFTLYFPLRERMQRLLIQAGPEGLQAYRSQADREARILLDRALQRHDEKLLARVASDFFASASGDEATLLLGDAALVRGDVTAARRAWLKMHPALRTSDEAAEDAGVYPALPWYLAWRGHGTHWQAHREHMTASDATSPLVAQVDASTSLPELHARLCLASLLSRDFARAAWELEVFRELHGNQQGRLAGRTVVVADALATMLADAQATPNREAAGSWTTFAGDWLRNGHAQQAGEIQAPDWKAELPRLKGDRDYVGQGRLRVAEHHDGLLSYHAAIHGRLALVASAEWMRAYRLDSGEVAWEVALRSGPPAEVPTNQQVGVPRFTVSISDGVAYVTLPAPMLPGRRAVAVRREDLSRIVGIDLNTRKLVFELVADDATVTFGGTPIVEEGKAFVVVRRQIDVQVSASVACYDVASGRLEWERRLSTAQTLAAGTRAQFDNTLLTLAGDTLYCNTNLGVVAAIAKNDGQPRWVMKYPRASFPAAKVERTDRHAFRDLNPCLVHHGLVYCAPSDSDRIFALDATSGALVWTLPPNAAADAVHLLGVAGNYLLASGDYLYWIHAVTGRIHTQYPAATPLGPGLALPTPRGWGRGIVAGDRVLWPTQSTLLMFDIEPEQKGLLYFPRLRHEARLEQWGATGGNLIVAGQRAVLATSDQLLGLPLEEATER